MQYFLQKLLEKSTENINAILIASIFFYHFAILLRRRKYATAGLMLISGSIVAIFSTGIISWFSGIGGDSLIEGSSFDKQEAFFWTSTFLSLLPQMALPAKSSCLVLVESTLLACIFLGATQRQPRLEIPFKFAPIALILYLCYVAYLSFDTQQKYVQHIQSSFDNNPRGFTKNSDVDLFVYIGESTSSLSMSLYGYPLPTTPRLQGIEKSDPGFIRFEKIRSTHTHTSESLLRALSLYSNIPGQEGKYWGISSILKSAHIKTGFYSVQPLTGSFSNFSHFIFGSFDYKISDHDRYKGNLAAPTQKDHQLLASALRDSGVVFFHSYAGHGNYLDLIDKNLSDPVHHPEIIFDGIYGAGIPVFMRNDFRRNVDEYNRTLTYIDRNVSAAIENIKSRIKPAALIYFSDHGESAYTRRGHESSQFIEEMSTVPLIIYFNEAYRRAFPSIFESYKTASRSIQTRFLDQLPASIIEIADIQSASKLEPPSLSSTKKHPHPVILERETLSGSSKIDFNMGSEDAVQEEFTGGNPEPTYISILNEYSQKKGKNTLCYHRADSYAKALRGAAVAKCIEFDLIVNDNSLEIHHPPAPATGFSIDHIFKIASARHNSLWIDAKNIDNPASCSTLASYLEKEHQRVGKILVEFPSNSIERITELRDCTSKLHSISARTSYYVPTELAQECLKNLDYENKACQALQNDLKKATESGIFTDLSFDIGYKSAIEKYSPPSKIHWNTWAIKPQDFKKSHLDDFDFVIMDTSSDPNTY